jgi:hypothetical protein
VRPPATLTCEAAADLGVSGGKVRELAYKH